MTAWSVFFVYGSFFTEKDKRYKLLAFDDNDDATAESEEELESDIDDDVLMDG